MIVDRSYKSPEGFEAAKSDKVIKIHLKNGELATLTKWTFNDSEKLISGYGNVYNRNRRLKIKETNFTIPYDDCALVETNTYSGGNGASPALMTLVTVLTTLPTIICVVDPKACFGSCPTFYTVEGDSLVIQAEGFSSSITRSMEETDVDRILYTHTTNTPEIRIELMNEALETHYIRSVRLISVESGDGETYHGNGLYYKVDTVVQALGSSTHPNEYERLLNSDGVEYISLADSNDLTRKEEIILDFESFQGMDHGILVTHRQTLLTTFLFYQSLAYMGTAAGPLMAAYESSSEKIRRSQKSIYNILGGIEVSVETSTGWKKIGTINEHGPIARDTHLLPIELDQYIRKVKLTMTQGLWKIDRVNAARISDTLEYQTLEPTSIVRHGSEDFGAMNRLLNYDTYLETNPGDSYTLIFTDQEAVNSNRQYFIESQGYYTEWMRQEWLAEQNRDMTIMLLKNPKKWIRMMSPKYKEAEQRMESLFWDSKFRNVRF